MTTKTCQHKNTTEEITGSMKFVNGDVIDTTTWIIVCLDCGEDVTSEIEAEVLRQAEIDRVNHNFFGRPEEFQFSVIDDVTEW